MRTISRNLLRIGIAVGSVAVMLNWPIGFVPILSAVIIWLVPRAYRDHQELVRRRAANRVRGARVTTLEAELTHDC
jgi:hypothetical protein